MNVWAYLIALVLIFGVHYIVEDNNKSSITREAIKNGCSRVLEMGSTLWKCPEKT